ncbi:hypothetical protein BH09PSE5_BH09PSE5_38190 [soil metagenome]
MTDSESPAAAKTAPPVAPSLPARGVGALSLTSGLAAGLLKLADANDQLVAIKDAGSWRYVYVNQPMASFIGKSMDEVVGRTDLELLGVEKSSPLRAADMAAAVQRTATRSEHRFEIAGQRRDFTAVRIQLAGEDDVEPKYQLGVWTETTTARLQDQQLRAAHDQIEAEQRMQVELRRQLRDQALRDETTGLYHHGHFQDQLRREVDLSTREHREFSLVSIALDPPDERLRAAGPEGRQRILEALGRLLHGNTRAMDASCRLDEEHFSVLLSGVGLATAHARMDGLRRQCAAQVVVQDGREIGFTVSMGVASFPHTSMSQDDLIDAADKALVQALARGNYVSLASITLE